MCRQSSDAHDLEMLILNNYGHWMSKYNMQGGLPTNKLIVSTQLLIVDIKIGGICLMFYGIQ